jgi:hypothetical protein
MASSDIPKSVKDQMDLTSDHIDNWLKNDLFHSGWWVLIALIVVSLAVWFVLLDKKRLRETLLFAALMAIIGLAINEYGEELILWDYPVDVIPIFPPLSSLNLLLLPLAYSLAYQYSKTAWRFLWATIAVTAVLCFAVEPLLSLGNLYQLLNWQYWWGFPFYAAAALLVRKVTVKIFKIEKRAEEVG